MSFLTSRFSSWADKPAMAGAWGATTFGELTTLLVKARAELKALAIHQPTAFALIGEHGPASTAWLLALEEAGHFVAPLSGNVAEHPKKLAQINAQWLITTEPLAWKMFPRVDEPSAHPLFQKLCEQSRAGLILFSSGTSGQPKAMVQDFTNLLATYELRHPSRLPLLALLGFDHIGGINTLLGALASGAVLPASPTFLNLLLASGEVQARDLSSLRVITYGTEPMPETLLGRLRQAFPRARFIQTFGTSETGIAQTESPDAGSTFFRFSDSGLKWKIIDEELWLQSRTQIGGYLNANSERFTEDGWFRTGDKAELGLHGTLRISGRVGEMINVGGEKLMPIEVESVILEVEGVTECRVFGESHALTGQTVAVDVVANGHLDQESLRAKIRTICRTKLARYKVPTRVNFVKRVSGERIKKQCKISI
ncbi:MAG: acyl--CoA ligase [Verrucomicrobia bacterium]|nr:acyl--CoA ligase [Verrucomicrobiota bacterium]